MPFTYDDEQRDFIETVTEFLRDRAQRSTAGTAQAGSELWGELLALDLPALLLPEELDGLGLSPVDLVAVLEAAGRFALAVPLAMTIGPFAAALVAAGPDDAGARELLGKLLAGATGTLAPTHRSPASGNPVATLDGRRLTVERVVVPDVDADLIAVPAVRAGGDELVLVVAPPAELGIVAREGMDGTERVGTLQLSEHELPEGATIHAYYPEVVLPVAWIAAAAELVGLAVELLDRSVAYATGRVQFGQPIGHFQGIKHRLVDVHLLIERARSLTMYGALALHEGRPDAVRAGHRAKAAASEAASAAARAAVQVHGGSGITAEEAVSGLYLRARQKSMLLGGADEHYELARAC